MSWGPVVFTMDAAIRMIQRERLGQLHPVLYRMPVWTDEDSDHAADDGMAAEFARVGWLGRGGRLSADGLDRLAVLVRPESEYAAWFTYRSTLHSALVAASGGEALVAYRQGDTVELRGLEPNESLAMALMRQLPDCPAAPVEAINFPVEQGRGSADAVQLGRLDSFTLARQGELYAGRRDRQRRYRSNRDNPVRFHDYRRLGRVMITTSSGYLSVTPGSKPVLRQRIEQVYRDLTD